MATNVVRCCYRLNVMPHIHLLWLHSHSTDSDSNMSSISPIRYRYIASPLLSSFCGANSTPQQFPRYFRRLSSFPCRETISRPANNCKLGRRNDFSEESSDGADDSPNEAWLHYAGTKCFGKWQQAHAGMDRVYEETVRMQTCTIKILMTKFK